MTARYSQPAKITRRHIARLRRPGSYVVGPAGLSLEIDETGARKWTLSIEHNGALRIVELGALSDVSLERARERACDVMRVSDLVSGPDDPEPVSKETLRKQVLLLTGKTYGQAVLEAWRKAVAQPHDPLRHLAIELAEKELLEALDDGEIVPKYRSRKVPDWKEKDRIAEHVERELRSGSANSLNQAAERIAEELDLDDSVAKKYYRAWKRYGSNLLVPRPEAK